MSPPDRRQTECQPMTWGVGNMASSWMRVRFNLSPVRWICRLFFPLGLALFSGATLRAEIVDINSLAFYRLHENITIIDIRRAEEWQHTGVVENSIGLTFFDKNGRYDAGKWLKSLSDLIDPNQPVALICHTGVRSKVVSRWLDRAAEYPVIYNVTDGIEGWLKQSFPVVSGPR